jgi:hypothetical protein
MAICKPERDPSPDSLVLTKVIDLDYQEEIGSWALVAHPYIHSYSGGRNQED